MFSDLEELTRMTWIRSSLRDLLRKKRMSEEEWKGGRRTTLGWKRGLQSRPHRLNQPHLKQPSPSHFTWPMSLNKRLLRSTDLSHRDTAGKGVCPSSQHHLPFTLGDLGGLWKHFGLWFLPLQSSSSDSISWSHEIIRKIKCINVIKALRIRPAAGGGLYEWLSMNKMK